ncbi:MAG: hypothetical protein LBK60_02065 [Verrucomicrobiales bacterium]|jgi:type II secretory pathway pseudopilin PulG|nr:hypothetical protein [Verrucomicrobiales bacterium]
MSLKHPAAAFTLTELLASCAILSVMLLAGAGLVQFTARSAARARQHAEFHRQARAAIRVLRNDFRHVTVSGDTPLYLNPPPEIAAMPDQAPAADGDTVFFFTNQPRFGRSELCAAGYYLDAARRLRRYFKDSDATWQSAGTDSGFLPHALDPARPLFPIVSGAAENETLLVNVSAFRVRARRTDTSVITDSPLTERPALLEITFKPLERDLTHEFTICIPCQ